MNRKTYLLRFALSLPFSKLYALMFRPYTVGMELRNPYNFRAPLFNTIGAIRMENLLKAAVKKPVSSTKIDRALRQGEINVELSVLDQIEQGYRNEQEFIAQLDTLLVPSQVVKLLDNTSMTSELGSMLPLRTWVQQRENADYILGFDVVVPMYENADLFRSSVSAIYEVLKAIKEQEQFTALDVSSIVEKISSVYLCDIYESVESFSSELTYSGQLEWLEEAEMFPSAPIAVFDKTETGIESKITEAIYSGQDYAQTTTDILLDSIGQAIVRLDSTVDKIESSEILLNVRRADQVVSKADKVAYSQVQLFAESDKVRHVSIHILENGEIRMEMVEQDLEFSEVRKNASMQEIESSQILLDSSFIGIESGESPSNEICTLEFPENGSLVAEFDAIYNESEFGLASQNDVLTTEPELAHMVLAAQVNDSLSYGTSHSSGHVLVGSYEVSSKKDLLDSAVNQIESVQKTISSSVMEEVSSFLADVTVYGGIEHQRYGFKYDLEGYIQAFAETDYEYARSIYSEIEKWYEVDKIETVPTTDVQRISTPVRYEPEITYIQEFTVTYHPTESAPQTTPDEQLIGIIDKISDSSVEFQVGAVRQDLYDSDSLELESFQYYGWIQGSVHQLSHTQDNYMNAIPTPVESIISGSRTISTPLVVNTLSKSVEYSGNRVTLLESSTSALTYGDNNIVSSEDVEAGSAVKGEMVEVSSLYQTDIFAGERICHIGEFNSSELSSVAFFADEAEIESGSITTVKDMVTEFTYLEQSARVNDVYDAVVTRIEGQNTQPVYTMYHLSLERLESQLFKGDVYLEDPDTIVGHIGWETLVDNEEGGRIDNYTRDALFDPVESGTYIKEFSAVIEAGLEDSTRIEPVYDTHEYGIEGGEINRIQHLYVVQEFESATNSESVLHSLYTDIESAQLNDGSGVAILDNKLDKASVGGHREIFSENIESCDILEAFDAAMPETETAEKVQLKGVLYNDIEDGTLIVQPEVTYNLVESASPLMQEIVALVVPEAADSYPAFDMSVPEVEMASARNEYKLNLSTTETSELLSVEISTVHQVVGGKVERHLDVFVAKFDDSVAISVNDVKLDALEGFETISGEGVVLEFENGISERSMDIHTTPVETSRLLDKIGVIIIGEMSELFRNQEVDVTSEELAVLLDKDGVILQDTTSDILIPEAVITQFTETERKKKRLRGKRVETSLGVGKIPDSKPPIDPPDEGEDRDDPTNPNGPEDKKTIWIIMGRPNSWSGWDWKKTR